ncbi:putative kinesin-associated protein [Operophtera brumata]|uniref:Putative kinesin-associated protein n=1 Tax=Operophtera brumata TaxID=104452 RepID=A0A0L7LN66_OPEBR|nr:putative kinesin-associated protein [Operophtera brumata]
MSPMESVPVAVLNSVDDYVELLYDDIPEKIKGSALILQLARNPDNLLELARNEALLSALSRVLREEWKRSIELSTNIVYTFFCFSTYNEFHPVIIQYKIGSLCMDVIDYELKRYDQWKEKSELPKSRIPEPKRRPKSGTWAVADVTMQKSRSLVSSYHEDLCSASEDCLSKNDEEQMKRKLKTLSKRQEQLLRVAFYMLLNIADNVKVEEKMHRKDVVGLLIGAMERHSNIDLLILIVSFLQKLSIFVENKNSMASRGVIEKLAPLLDSSNADLVNVTLKLLFNLTFDTKLRNKMIKIGLLPKLIQFTSDDKHINLVMKILYHLSMDDRVKVMFTQSDCVKLVSGAPGATDVLLALCANLAWCERAAEHMAAEGRLKELLARAFRHRTTMLMKLVRNLSHHPQNKPLFVEFVGDIAGAVTAGGSSEEFLVECLGTLSNILDINTNIDVFAVVERYNLVSCIMKILDPERSRDPELSLEGVVLAGAICAEARSATALAAGGGGAALVALLRLRQADDEHVLQTVFAFRQMLSHPAAAECLVSNTEAPAYLIDLMQDKNVEIRKMCDTCLDIISQMKNEWAVRIKVERFRCHNGQWLSVVETLGEGGAGDFTDDLPPYLSAEYLTTHRLTTSEPCIVFRCHNGQWLSVVETLGEGGAGDFTDDLQPYLSAEYLTTHRLTTSEPCIVFRCHNGQWLSVVETLGEGGAGDCTDDLPPYLSAEYLTTHRLTTSGKLEQSHALCSASTTGSGSPWWRRSGDCTDDLPPYLSAEYLTTHRLTTSGKLEQSHALCSASTTGSGSPWWRRAGDCTDDLPPYLSAEYLTTHRLTTSDSQTSLNDDSDSFSGDGDVNNGTKRHNGLSVELYGSTDSSSGKAAENECFVSDLSVY